MRDSVAVQGEAAEVALGEAQAVLAMVQDDERRGRLADLVASVGEGELGADEQAALEELLVLGLQTGRIRALYGPGGETAALGVYRRLPQGRELGESARGVSDALGSLAGKTLDGISVQAVGPGAFVLSLTVEGMELSVRLDRSGARLGSVGL